MEMEYSRGTEIQFSKGTLKVHKRIVHGKIGANEKALLITTCPYITANMLLKHFDSLLLTTYKTIEKLYSGHFCTSLHGWGRFGNLS